MGFVDLLLNFSHPLGNSYEGRWHDDDKAFTVTIRDAGNGTVSMTPKFRNCTADRVTGGTVIDERYGKPCTFGEIYVHDPATTVSLRAPVRTRGGGSPPVVINATNQDLQGNLGQNDTAPRVVEMIGRETKLPDLTGFANFEGEWTIELRLDRATDRGGVRGQWEICHQKGTYNGVFHLWPAIVPAAASGSGGGADGGGDSADSDDERAAGPKRMKLWGPTEVEEFLVSRGGLEHALASTLIRRGLDDGAQLRTLATAEPRALQYVDR